MSLKKKKKKEASGDILIRKFPMRLAESERKLVDRLRIESARLWNDILDLHWWLYDVYKLWTNASDKKKWFNAKSHNLHSQTIQAIIELHEETCERTKIQRYEGNKNWKYPWKYKRFFSVKYKKSALSLESNGYLKLSNGGKEKPLYVKKPKHIDFGSIKNAEIVWHQNEYWLHLGVELTKKEKVTGKNNAGGDLGIIHAITLSNGKNHLIITGKELRSLHRFRNKTLAKLQKKISKKQKGSNARYKLILRKRRFLEKMERKIEYIEHCISKQVVNWCEENQIKTLFIGTPEGIQRGTKKKRKTRKIQSQQLSNWSFGRLTKLITYKLKLIGTEVLVQEESYTSATCPKCGTYTKQSSRKFNCSCGEKGHRDVVGAINILDKGLNGEITKGRNLPKIENTKYRRVNLVPIAKSKKYKLTVA
ncbi:RNA-guided endonuclease InsQ/TnpB family protein [Neobacillus citreus]|uniref:Transposase n=1 Tax=Neobacillus citreus TaxID=2833578 RepID=A0A942SUA8_9BACI|nr:RNA-guided endonuclease TnpB family protein [Neobacillus citreus]MCH6266315.1 transposase [Neobacillus citreus]